MFYFSPRRFVPLLLATIAVIALFQLSRDRDGQEDQSKAFPDAHFRALPKDFRWKDLLLHHPVTEYVHLPTGPLKRIPAIQTDFDVETAEEEAERQQHLSEIKEAFRHSWRGYSNHAWMRDEVSPLSGLSNNDFGGMGATLVDSLDTLWIMGLKDEFEAAIADVEKIDFSSTRMHFLNIFETTIRFLGGLLGAYDVSGQQYPVLLKKAVELGNMLYLAFDTPNRMPITRWDWQNTVQGGDQEAESHAFLAEVGSLSLEFTRLSQLTGEPKWYDAVARVTTFLHDSQNQTKIPGLWPNLINMQDVESGRDTTFTMGSMADSTYEYLPKQYLLLGGLSDQHRSMYSTALESAKANLLFQPLTPRDNDMLLAGTRKRMSVLTDELVPNCEHLSCFAGGMVALASRTFQQPKELETARKLVDGCLWAYESTASGIMPEIFTAVPCDEVGNFNCTWSQQSWYDAVDLHAAKQAYPSDPTDDSAEQIIFRESLSPGMVGIPNARYNLRPEAIESMFVLYRITGDRTLPEKAWSIFRSIHNATRTEIAYAAVKDVTQKQPPLSDSMESFWTAETLKYFYLMFSEPDLVSLDEYVLNTEAHPLLRPKQDFRSTD